MKGARYEKLGLQCAEGVSGVWHYHLRHPGKTNALCGALVMYSGRPLHLWGQVPRNHHIPESFCSTCETKAEAL